MSRSVVNKRASNDGNEQFARRISEVASTGLYYDLENKIIAAIKPQPAFLPILRMLSGVVEYDEAKGLLVTERWQDRNRRATATLSPVLIYFQISSSFLSQKLQLLQDSLSSCYGNP